VNSLWIRAACTLAYIVAGFFVTSIPWVLAFITILVIWVVWVQYVTSHEEPAPHPGHLAAALWLIVVLSHLSIVVDG